jgi:hypothetical protein
MCSLILIGSRVVYLHVRVFVRARIAVNDLHVSEFKRMGSALNGKPCSECQCSLPSSRYVNTNSTLKAHHNFKFKILLTADCFHRYDSLVTVLVFLMHY